MAEEQKEEDKQGWECCLVAEEFNLHCLGWCCEGFASEVFACDSTHETNVIFCSYVYKIIHLYGLLHTVGTSERGSLQYSRCLRENN